MKINKVLLGLFAGVLALMGGSAKAQFYEIGPTNIGGHVSSIVVDRDTTHTTIYAGAMSGGLFVRTDDTSVLANLYAKLSDRDYAAKLTNATNDWHLVRYIDNSNQEMTLPISAMNQTADGIIVLGTGDDTYPIGSTYNKMSIRGRGIYLFDPEQLTFTLLSKTSTEEDNRFAAIHKIESYTKNDTTYLFVATSTGLYRWKINVGATIEEWQAATPYLVQSGKIEQLLVVNQLNLAYFTIGNQLYRIGDLTVANGKLNPINISATNSAFGGINTTIKLAVAPSNPTYLYAMVTDQNGIMDNVYLTTNGQTWEPIATNSVAPYNFVSYKNSDGKFDTIVYNSGLECGVITVDPTNEKRIIIAGSSIWTGEGFIEGVAYTWTRNSYSERELNAGDYMSNVYNNTFFVHSGIHQIVAHYDRANDTIVYYFATDGGIYTSSLPFYSFTNINRGLNNVQINSVAVCPDGSIISGAEFNANPFIESRLAHNGGEPTTTWFDDGSLGNTNHDANILWTGNGGKVAASSFQRITPSVYRNIFVSSENGRVGRAFSDYLNYRNTQTWTIGSSFLTTEVIGGPARGSVYLWENDNDKYMRDSIYVQLDQHGYFFDKNGDTIYPAKEPNRKIKEGDYATFLCRANANYPFTHVFTDKEIGKSLTDSFYVKNPIASRMLIIADIGEIQTSVLYSWTANDFSKVYDSIVDNNKDLDSDVKTNLRKKFMWWAPMFTISRNSIIRTNNIYPRNAVMSPDGRYAYISTYNDSLHRSQIYRISGFEKVDFTAYPLDVRRQINSASDTATRVLRNTVISRNSGTDREWFNRPISSITVDPRPGVDRLVVTFEDYSETYGNVAIIENVTTNHWEVSQNSTAGIINLPAYCSMIEETTGDVYVGTDNGVYIYNGASWRHYEHLRGIPVTSITQQNKSYSLKRAINHTGITENKYLFAKTKWPHAIYFGTYGRGIFMDMTYVTDMENEISDSSDYMPPVSIPTVESNGENSIFIFPNPVMDKANLTINAAEGGYATLRIYDLNGRMVQDRQLGYVAEGTQEFTINTNDMTQGMYLVNVTIGGYTSATKLMVR